MKKLLKVSVFPLALVMGSSVLNAAQPGVYLGAGGGVGVLRDEPGLIKDDGVLAGRLFLGYNFNRYVGVETNFTAFETAKVGSSRYPNLSGDYSFNALSLVGKAYLPFSKDSPFNVYALLGVAEANNKLKVYNNYGSAVTVSDNGLVANAGFGASYDLNQNFTLGLEFSAFGEKKSSSSMGIASNGLGTLSLAYKF